MRVLPSLSNTINFLSSSSSKEAVPGKYERDICNQLPHVKLSENFRQLGFHDIYDLMHHSREDTKDMRRKVIIQMAKSLQ